MSRLEERLEGVDQRRRALLREVEALAPEARTARPRPDKWSILEIVEHLVLAERAALDDAEKRGYGVAGRRRLKHRLAYGVVMLALRSPVPVKVPSRVMLPEGGRTLTELREMWDENHRRIRELVEGLDPDGLARAIFRHPIAGPMTPAQTVAMLSLHLDRHAGQIRRLAAWHEKSRT